MNYKISFFTIIISAFFSCNNKMPYVPDYEMGKGTVIGIETCNIDSTKNAWLISFPDPSVTGKSYGNDIVYNNKPYGRVVRTFSLPDSHKISDNKYYFEFNLEGMSIPECKVKNANAGNLMKIQIRKVSTISD
ncbi:hypothetical protein [Pedobacter agri]|uniref:hypothetical protein n=1 Tax=Pedobacter agri TaxID=454586 RepID=UPI002930644C|nr:hypothetical protein [Pedobacter agri]